MGRKTCKLATSGTHPELGAAWEESQASPGVCCRNSHHLLMADRASRQMCLTQITLEVLFPSHFTGEDTED